MNKITFKNYYFLWITLFFLVSNNVTSQILPCVVHENVSAYSSNTFGQPQTTFAIPNNYPITPKKFRIKFWKVQAISESLKVNAGQYAPGLYRVVLVCDNNVIESHNLVIQ